VGSRESGVRSSEIGVRSSEIGDRGFWHALRGASLFLPRSGGGVGEDATSGHFLRSLRDRGSALRDRQFVALGRVPETDPRSPALGCNESGAM
jgi:hypothetical protein